jgi:uncharacterized coiled-coil protein SlyX
MATTFGELEARVRGLEVRAQRAEEDVTAIVMTVVETRDDVKDLKSDVRELKDDVRELKGKVHWLTSAVQAMLDHQGLTVQPERGDDTNDKP